jgi:hypothetical protein
MDDESRKRPRVEEDRTDAEPEEDPPSCVTESSKGDIHELDMLFEEKKER